MTVTKLNTLADQIQEACGENVYSCFQCKKCTAGCPVVEHFDLAPHRMLRAIQFGQKDLVLSSRTLWLCASCEACYARCPQAVSFPRIIDALRIMAAEEGVKPAVKSVPDFYADKRTEHSLRTFEIDDLVCPRTSRPLSAASTFTFHKNLQRLPFQVSVDLEADPSLQLLQRFGSSRFFLFQDPIFQSGGPGSGSGRKLERKEAVEPDTAHHIQGVQEILLLFRGKPNDHVRRDGQFGDPLSKCGYPIQVVLDIIPPAHG